MSKTIIFGDGKIGMNTCVGTYQGAVAFFKVPEGALEQEDYKLEDPELLFIFKNVKSIDSVIGVLQELKEEMEDI